MAYDFTTLPDRRGTHALKWDNILPGEGEAIPLWVADMDFAAPPVALAALKARVDHPIFGYTNLPPGYFQTVCAWYARRYGRTWEPKHLVAAPSVLHAMSMAIRTFTNPGDRILNLPPIYYPFFKLARLNGREILDVPLVKKDRWTMDFAAMDQALTASRAEGKPVKALLFSCPHNPTGRVWTRSELEALGELAIRHDFLILSDEIHADLVARGQKHLGPLDLPHLANRTLVFAGPNKTFNLAGLPLSHVAALDDGLRARMKAAIEADFFDQPNVLSLAAAWAAYQGGEAWLEELIDVIAAHKAVLDRWVAEVNAAWGLGRPLVSEPLEATYLAWVEVSGLIQKFGFENDKDLGIFLEKTARVKFTVGSTFQTGGENHLRVNLATPATVLQEGLDRVRQALEKRKPV